MDNANSLNSEKLKKWLTTKKSFCGKLTLIGKILYNAPRITSW